MKKRASVLLDEETYGRLERRALRRGHTVSEELRCAVDEALSTDATVPDETSPNAGWEPLIGLVDSMPAGIPHAGAPGFKAWLRESIADKVQNEMREH